MSKNQSVKVGIRIRPLNKRQTQMKSPVCTESHDNVLGITKEKDTKQFIFDYVFGMDSRQENIYQNCAFNLVQNGLQGYNGTVFAYGQTGAGKTFTMVGDYKDPQIKGIIPRCFDHVIAAIHTSEERMYVVRASFIQIYNEDIIDLLEQKKGVKKDLKQNPGKGVFIKDLKMVAVKSVDEMFKVLDIGNINRSVSATKMNATSSRSHALFTIHIQSLQGKDKVRASKINLVDLAGSERQSKTQATGDRLKQGAKINLSLTALGNVINALVDGKKGGHIPYRDSKLTRLLQDSLGGNTKTLMIASVSPAADNYDETISTLRYAARARNIKNTPKINEDPKDAMIRQYLQEIQRLKKQLGTGGGGQVNMSEEMSFQNSQQLKRAQQQAQRKLDEKDNQLMKMKQKLKQMQEMVLKKEEVSPQILKNRKLKKKKAQKQQQLIEKKIQDYNKENDELLDDENQQKDDKGSDYWRNIAKKLRKKLKTAIQEQKDLQKQFQTQRTDLNKTIRQLQSDLSFYRQLAQKFISHTQITTIKENAQYDQQRRQYTLPPFLMHQGQVNLPKSLRRYQVEDLWHQKRKNNKLQLLGSDLPSVKKKQKQQAKFTSYQQPTGSPFRQTKRLFKLSDYTQVKYEQKQIDISDRGQQIFRRTRFKMNDRTNSRSRSRSNSTTKLQPLKHSDKSLQPLRAVSKGKEKLAPIKRV